MRPGARSPRGSLADLPRSLTVLVLVAAAVAAPACGGSAKSTYKDDFPPISRKVVALGQKVGKTVDSAGQASNGQLADDFGRYGREMGDLGKQLAGLDPPKDLAGAQDRLVSAMGAVQGALDDISQAVRRGDPGAARSATAQLIQRAQRLRDARTTLAVAVRKL
jgi:uncharacterized protein YukE